MCLEASENLEAEAIEFRGTGDERETILFVEDESFVREVTSEVLRSAGYRVLTSSSAAEALSMFQDWRSDVALLLTDVVLPGETGRVLAGKLRREKAGLKVLLVTGYAEEMAELEAKQEECLRKPFSTSVLLKRVREVLDEPRWLREMGDAFRRACENE